MDRSMVSRALYQIWPSKTPMMPFLRFLTRRDSAFSFILRLLLGSVLLNPILLPMWKDSSINPLPQRFFALHLAFPVLPTTISFDIQDFQEYFLSFFKGSEHEKVLEQIEWKRWLHFPGLPPVSQKLDLSLVETCNHLAEKSALFIFPYRSFLLWIDFGNLFVFQVGKIKRPVRVLQRGIHFSFSWAERFHLEF